jgi:hypothetical protein
VEIKASFLNLTDFLKSSCGDTSHFDVSLSLCFLQCRPKNKSIVMHTVKQNIEVGME